MEIGWIRRCGAGLRFTLSLHAERERQLDAVSLEDISTALASATILEEYEDTGRGRSCLLLGYAGGRALHLVAGLDRIERLVMITVYPPAMPKWKNERERNN